MTGVSFIPARHYKPAARTVIDLIVIHSAEVGESLESAEAIARGFARQRFDAKGAEIVSSAHYSVDADSIVQSVHDEDVAFHAPGANANGIGIELAGRAAQTAEQWDDDYSRSVIARAANLTAALCRKWGIPVAFVSAEGLLQKYKGITTHANVSLAFKRSTHSDPGPAFPMARFIELVRTYSAQLG